MFTIECVCRRLFLFGPLPEYGHRHFVTSFSLLIIFFIVSSFTTILFSSPSSVIILIISLVAFLPYPASLPPIPISILHVDDINSSEPPSDSERWDRSIFERRETVGKNIATDRNLSKHNLRNLYIARGAPGTIHELQRMENTWDSWAKHISSTR